MMSKFQSIAIRLFKKCWLPLAIVVLFIAIVFTTFRALTPWAKQYKGDVEKHLSILLGQPVKIQDLETSWYWFEPVLKMNQVTVSNGEDHVLKLNKLLVGINLLSSLWHWQIQPGVLYVDHAHITLRQRDSQWEIDGLSSNKEVMNLEPASYLPALSWLLSQQKIIIKNVSASIYFKDNPALQIKDVNFMAVHSYGHYRLNGRAQLAQETPTSISIIADLQCDPTRIKKVDGHGYISLQHLVPTQWQNIIPKTALKIQNGEGSAEIWFDVLQGKLKNLQSKFSVNHLAWTYKDSAKPQAIQSLQANVAWQKKLTGWKLTADKIQLQTEHINWLDNALSMEYRQTDNAYRAYIKKTLLESILDIDIDWPEKLSMARSMRPHGELHDTQIEIKEGQVNYFLSRFVNFGWRANQKIPGVQQISGVLYWEPQEGRLELDGENTLIKPLKLPPLKFELFNAAFDWKTLNKGVRISMDRFVVSHPNLVLSARGALDNPRDPVASNLRLSAEFAANNGQNIMPYIPAAVLKPKLNEWLKHDVKRIEKASGRIMINGSLGDFPYDHSPGQFLINSHLNGVDLYITPQWPLNQNIDANLRVNKRRLEADIFQAELQGVPVDKINLAINDIGLGREALLIHGNLDAPANGIKSYLFASPLRKQLSSLNYLSMTDPVGLDLQLEIPLYPESDHVLAKGAVTFDQDKAILHMPYYNLPLENLSGTLQFDEFGITEGGVQGNLLGEPVVLQAHTFLDPKPYTRVDIQGATSIDLLRKSFKSPILDTMDGHLNIQSQYTFYNNPHEKDRIHVETNLQGVTVDLPAPLGKQANDITPFSLDAEITPNQSTRLYLKYADQLQSALLIANQADKSILKKGEIHLGAGTAVMPKENEIRIVGTLPAFDVQAWRTLFAKLSTQSSSPSLFDKIRTIALKFNSIQFFNQHYKDLNVTIRKLAQDNWAIKLSQEKMQGDLTYQPQANRLSGHFKRFYVDKVDAKRSSGGPTEHISPLDIPNLNLTVEQLYYGDIDVGELALQSTSKKTQWILDHCSIKTPEYQFQTNGQWLLDNKQNSTSAQSHLLIYNLGKSLERWHITPAVHAKQGDIKFEGQWPGAFYDFSLNKMNGTMQITLKNGRISHFDKETEEKLGLGKLLSILSLQTIPRRLTLDFSDLSEQGYSFDIFKGSFILKRGIMSTNDSYIDGPVAYASMKGDLDLSKHLYDLDLRVNPYVAASLPVVATIAGGPIAGLATWAASNIINKGMQKISGYTYKISGPWLDPVVQQVSIDKVSRSKPKNE